MITLLCMWMIAFGWQVSYRQLVHGFRRKNLQRDSANPWFSLSVDAHWWFSHFCCLEESHHLVLLDEVAVLIDTQMVSCQKSPVKKLVVIRLENEP